MSENHTPGPWTIGPYYRGDILASGRHVCHCVPFSSEQAAVDAEFIVRACNNYDELLTALKYLTDAAEMDFCGGSTIDCGDEESVAMGDGSAFTFGMIRKARAVIRKAEGR